MLVPLASAAGGTVTGVRLAFAISAAIAAAGGVSTLALLRRSELAGLQPLRLEPGAHVDVGLSGPSPELTNPCHCPAGTTTTWPGPTSRCSSPRKNVRWPSWVMRTSS